MTLASTRVISACSFSVIQVSLEMEIPVSIAISEWYTVLVSGTGEN